MQFLDVAFSGLAEYVLEHCQATQIGQLRAQNLQRPLNELGYFRSPYSLTNPLVDAGGGC
jgi:hypothetical protein